uniref:transposase n=1 Tax=Chryseobacterium takakiae TaxID=1302685 RepID=UPI000933EDC9
MLWIGFTDPVHLIINDNGEILDFILTTGNVHDREPLKSMDLHKWIFKRLLVIKAISERPF